MQPGIHYVVAVVDDDVRVLESLEDLLQSAGHRVHLYRSARALLEDDAFRRVDCVVSDIGMPGIDGYELERRARAARPELAVVLITGRRELIAARPASNRDAARDILVKPFGEADLLGAIARALGRRAPRP